MVCYNNVMTHPILWTVILGGIGVLNTIYLSYHAIRKTYVKCLFFPEESCRKVQESKYSKTMGIPNGFLGFGMYALIFVLALLYHYGAVATFVPALALIFIGFLFSLYFRAE